MDTLNGEVIEAAQVGRPPKYNKSYCQLVINLAKEGKSISHFLVKSGICKTAYYKWLKSHEDFKDSVDLAEEARKDFWEEKMRKIACGEKEETEARLYFPALDKMFSHYNSQPKTESKGLIINNNIINSDQKSIEELSPEERQKKLEILYQKREIQQQKKIEVK